MTCSGSATSNDSVGHGHAGRQKNGKINSPTYTSWRMMIQRCYNKNRSDYDIYGGRGIRVFFDWVGPGGFVEFLRELGPRPSRSHSLDRIDGDAGYEPGNVRWATKSVQNSNKSGFLVEFGGERMTIAGWADRLGLNPSSLRMRFSRDYRRGMTRDEVMAWALTTPARFRHLKKRR